MSYPKTLRLLNLKNTDMIGRKFSFLLMLFTFLIFSISIVQAQSTVCIVYFTGIGCPNCGVTDPIILAELPKNYSNLIVMEYELYKEPENPSIMNDYVSSYNLYPGVPQVLFDQAKNFVGRIDVLKTEEEINKTNNNSCPLKDGSAVDFNDLDITSLLGHPKIWARGRVLMSSGANSGDSDLLKDILMADDISEVLNGIEYETIKPIAVEFSNKKVEFKHAIKLGDWVLEWEEKESEQGGTDWSLYFIGGISVFLFVIISIIIYKKYKIKVKLK